MACPNLTGHYLCPASAHNEYTLGGRYFSLVQNMMKNEYLILAGANEVKSKIVECNNITVSLKVLDVIGEDTLAALRGKTLITYLNNAIEIKLLADQPYPISYVCSKI